jgi:hypothetical protein
MTPVNDLMTPVAHISDGDVVWCPACTRARFVFTIEAAAPIHCIKCDEGIYIVGVDHATVPPRLVIDHSAR